MENYALETAGKVNPELVEQIEELQDLREAQETIANVLLDEITKSVGPLEEHITVS